MRERGVEEDEVIRAIRCGTAATAKQGRLSYRADFPFGKKWQGKFYRTKQVHAIVAEEQDLVVVTVISYYF